MPGGHTLFGFGVLLQGHAREENNSSKERQEVSRGMNPPTVQNPNFLVEQNLDRSAAVHSVAGTKLSISIVSDQKRAIVFVNKSEMAVSDRAAHNLTRSRINLRVGG